jgi:hypothetical protein
MLPHAHASLSMRLIFLMFLAIAHCEILVPANTPNVWGGPAHGHAGMTFQSGHMFAFSGADGPTKEGSGFVGLLLPERYAIGFNAGKEVPEAVIRMSLDVSGLNNGTLVAASSDVLLVNEASDSKLEAMTSATIVLAHKEWDLMVGTAPIVSLQTAAVALAACNVTGVWETVTGLTEVTKKYDLAEGADGTYSATYETPGTWTHAHGVVQSTGAISIAFDNGKTDSAVLDSACEEIRWSVGGTWTRFSGPTPAPTPKPTAPAGVKCDAVNQMTLCQNLTSLVFALAYGPDASAHALAAVTGLTRADVDAVATGRLAPLGALPGEVMRILGWCRTSGG